MSKYLFIESRDPFECSDVKQQWDLAGELAGLGNEVTMFLVQNGVFAARSGARVDTLGPAVGITVLVDDFSLSERGISPERLRESVSVSNADALTDLIMEDGCKPVWS
ncbi:MAG: putative peroxiredoxin [Chlamydiales bacterium]|jgi:predicted peroxiredoxin